MTEMLFVDSSLGDTMIRSDSQGNVLSPIKMEPGKGLGFGVQGLGFRVQGLGLRISRYKVCPFVDYYPRKQGLHGVPCLFGRG